MSNEYEDKDINSMILFMRVNNIAEFQYIDNDSDLKFYDYQTDKHYTREDIIELATENNWKKDWSNNG